MTIHNVAFQMVGLASDCTGRPFRNLIINSPMRTVWNTGAFMTVKVGGMDRKPQLIELGSDLNAMIAGDLRFKIECMNPSDSSVKKVCVMINTVDSYGIRTTVSVICPSEISAKIDFDQIRHDMPVELAAPKSVAEHPICCTSDLAEDVPRCREIVSRLCRELTAQLYDHGYWLRSLTSGEFEFVDEEPAEEEGERIMTAKEFFGTCDGEV